MPQQEPERAPEGHIIIHSRDEIPESFASYQAEAEFFSTHEFGPEFWENPEPLSQEHEALIERIRQRRAARK